MGFNIHVVPNGSRGYKMPTADALLGFYFLRKAATWAGVTAPPLLPKELRM